MTTLDLTAAAALLHAHPQTVREQAAAGTIPAAKIGRAWVFIESDLLDHLRSQYKMNRGNVPCDSTNAAPSGGRISAKAVEKALAREKKPPPSSGHNIVPFSFGSRTS